MTRHGCSLRARAGVQEVLGAAARPYSNVSPLLCAPLSFPGGFLTGWDHLMFSCLAVLKLTPAKHCGVCFGVQEGVPVSASIPSGSGRMVVGLEKRKREKSKEKSWGGVDVHDLCPLQRMNRPGKPPAPSCSSMFPLQAVMGFPAWTPRRAVSVTVGSGSSGCFCACHWEVAPW